jgi:SAM-dependent methyltransferase
LLPDRSEESGRLLASGSVTQARHRDLLASIDLPQRSRGGSFEAVLEIAEGSGARRVLDVPSGPGRLAEALRRLGFAVTAGDLDGASFGAREVPFCVLDLERPLPFADGVFDLVHCGDGIEHLENPFLLVRECARVLAEKGLLVIATPNYLNVERRLSFLLTGSLSKPVPRVPAYYAGARFDRGHINPLTLPRLASMAENADLELVEWRTLLPKPRQRLLAPLALAIRAGSFLMRTARRRDLFAEHTQSLAMLLGGKTLIAVFRKGAGPPGP